MPSTGGWIPRGHGERWEREWADGSTATVEATYSRFADETWWFEFRPSGYFFRRNRIGTARTRTEAQRLAEAKHKRFARDQRHMRQARKHKLWGLF